MKIRILRRAAQDLIEGFHFYEQQRQGLGSRFVATALAEIDALHETGGIHPLYFGEFHRKLIAKFPFAIYYQVDDSVVAVYAVLDCRRNPAWIRGRLSPE